MQSLIFPSLLLLLSPFISAQSQDPHLQKYTISSPGINVTFIPFGATTTSVIVNDKNGNPRDVAVGYDDPAAYVNDTATVHTFFGALVGRYINRIKNGTFSLNGEEYHIPKNEHGGLNTLHGGDVGYDRRNWTVVSHNESTITFSLLDQAYEGFPGSVVNYVTFTVSTDSITSAPSWTISIVSVPLDEPTPIMLSTHMYWNLGAFSTRRSQTILNDTLHMPYADRYIKGDNIQVPTGEIGVVSDPNNFGASLDFTRPKQIGRDIAKSVDACGFNCTGYDNAFILDRPITSLPSSQDISVLRLSSPDTGIQMDVYTNQQSLQIYTCDKQDGTIPLKKSQGGGERGEDGYVQQYGCVVIEEQGWIDGVNHPEWGQERFQIFSPETGPAVAWTRYEFSTTG